MRKIVVLMHISLDGFVAGPNGEMDWIHIDETLFDLVAISTRKADAALYGRKTYEMMQGYWPTAAEQPGATKHDKEHGHWYNSVTKIVISSSMKGTHPVDTVIIDDHVADKIRLIKTQAGKDILIFGSPTACHTLMQEDLIDEYWLFVNPVLLGNGIPLFKNINGRKKLKVASTKALASGVVCLQYAT